MPVLKVPTQFGLHARRHQRFHTDEVLEPAPDSLAELCQRQSLAFTVMLSVSFAIPLKVF
jgi:hypothetical protein